MYSHTLNTFCYKICCLLHALLKAGILFSLENITLRSVRVAQKVKRLLCWDEGLGLDSQNSVEDIIVRWEAKIGEPSQAGLGMP